MNQTLHFAAIRKSRNILNRYLPGLDDLLKAESFDVLEREGNPGIAAYKQLGGAGFLIPKAYRGLGATPYDAVHVQLAIAARSPSLGVAVNMHNFSVATLVEMVAQSDGAEGLFLEAIASQNLLVASGFAEGRAGQGILSPSMLARAGKGGIYVSGSKKPCSLAYSMDLLTASVTVNGSNGHAGEPAVVLIPAAAKGIMRKKFWNSPLLGGAESDEVILENVFVEDQLVYPLLREGAVEPSQLSGYIWFELLITATYVGVVAGLAERVILSGRGNTSGRVRIATLVEQAVAALAGTAFRMQTEPRDSAQLAEALMVRYAIQDLLTESAGLAAELMGGMAYIAAQEVSYLYAASRALAFHPPSRTVAEPALLNYIEGREFVLP